MPQFMTESVRNLANRVRSGAVRAEAVVQDAVEAHEANGARLNAYVEWGGTQALERARELDRTVADGGDPGPLAGVPVSVKDLFGVEGFSTRAGTPKTLPRKWESEGFLVRRLKAAGAIVMGKTHTVELAYGGVGVNPHWGTPRNPWDASTHRVPGGSSAGAGVSLQEGSALIAVGSDTGGSIRIPASVTGTVGHKQTTGRWPTSGVVPLSTTLDAVGFLTRTVDDAAYAFRVIDHAVDLDPLPDAPLRDLNGLRLGILKSDLWKGTSPDIRTALETAIAEIETGGAAAGDVSGSLFDEATDQYLSGGLVSAECTAFLARELEGWMELLDPTIARRLESAQHLSATAYLDTLARRGEMRQASDELFGNVDLLVAPTVPITPPPLGELDDLDHYLQINRTMLSATCAVSFLDLCAISIPVGLDSAGMPVGMQLIARRGRDVDLLAWTLALEAALGTGPERLGSPPG